MTPLTAHLNVFDDAVDVASSLGYSISAEEDLNENVVWEATKGDFAFYARDPIELLGLIAIHVQRAPLVAQPYWWSRCKEDLVGPLLQAASLSAERARDILRDEQAHEKVESALQSSGWDSERAAKSLSIQAAHLTMILDLPEYWDIRDKLDASAP